MFRSFSLFRIFGIPIRVHASLLIFLPLIGFWLTAGSGPVAFAFAVGLMVCAFGCVLLHELGHSLAAMRHGIRTRAITLTPLGGLAGLEDIPRDPWKELEITVAGPAVNFVLAGIFGVAGIFFPSFFLAALMTINLWLGIFNLIPGFPMDGGRILRSLLAFRLPYQRATVIATKVGQYTAIAMGIAGLALFNPMLVLIAVFVYFAAAAERRRVVSPPNPFAEQILRSFFQQQRPSGSGFSGTRGAASPFSPPPGSTNAGHSEGVNQQDRVVLEVGPDGKVRRFVD